MNHHRLIPLPSTTVSSSSTPIASISKSPSHSLSKTPSPCSFPPTTPKTSISTTPPPLSPNPPPPDPPTSPPGWPISPANPPPPISAASTSPSTLYTRTPPPSSGSSVSPKVFSRPSFTSHCPTSSRIQYVRTVTISHTWRNNRRRSLVSQSRGKGFRLQPEREKNETLESTAAGTFRGRDRRRHLL